MPRGVRVAAIPTLRRAASLLWVLCLALTGADLPVHCLQPEIAGGWTFFLGASETLKRKITVMAGGSHHVFFHDPL